MLALPDSEISYWRSTLPSQTYPKLYEELETDVVVIGGGITGLTSAYLLIKAGMKVVVLEKARLGSGTTGFTTGKVTSQHNLIYSSLIQLCGEQGAKIYADANQLAISFIESVVQGESIDCDWQRDDNFVFTVDPTLRQIFQKESKDAQRLHLPASFETKTELPFPIDGAVKFSDQARLDAQKYITGLATAITNNRGEIFENSQVTHLRDGERCYVRTKDGAVWSKHIIIATNVPTYPLLARGSYCFLEYPTTSYIVVAETPLKFNGMYISPNKNHYSILPTRLNNKNAVLIGGQAHLPGFGTSQNRYQPLANYAEDHFKATNILYKWQARDYIAYDNVPLVGKIYPWSINMYVATAFKKWGLTNGTVAAMILRDCLMNIDNPWAQTFDSLRLKPLRSIPGVVFSSLRKK